MKAGITRESRSGADGMGSKYLSKPLLCSTTKGRDTKGQVFSFLS